MLNIADLNELMLNMVMSGGGSDPAVFARPLPPVGEQQPQAFESHFKTFVGVMALVVECDTQQSCEVLTARQAWLVAELQNVLNAATDHMTLHGAELKDVRGTAWYRVMDDSNIDIGNCFGDIGIIAMQRQQQYPLSVPANGSGPAMRQPIFTRLKGLISEASPCSLVGRPELIGSDWMATGKGKAGMAAVKQYVEGGAGAQQQATCYRAPPQKQRQLPFVQALRQ